MTKQTINLGTYPKGSDGDTSRVGFAKANENFDELYAMAQGKAARDVAGGAGTVALTAEEAQNGFIELTGILTGNRVVTVAATPPRSYIVRNSTTGNFSLSFQTTAGTGVSVSQGATTVVFSDGVNVVDAAAASVAAALSAAAAKEVGRLAYFPFATPPEGYLKGNGGAVSRATYAALFAKIGTMFGAGDGSTTFNLPELRGEFVRGLDDGRGIDAGRVLGSSQSATEIYNSNGNAQIPDGTFMTKNGEGSTDYAGTPVLTVGFTAGSASKPYVKVRPRNVAWLGCIKY